MRVAPGRQRLRVGLAPAPAARRPRTQRSAGGRGLPSSCASVSRSSTSVCMRSACCVISASTRVRSASVSGRLAIVSTKPASTVSGVRISCDTLATKSRRIASARSRSVMSCDSTQLQAVAVGRHQHRQRAAAARARETSPARRTCRPAGRRRRPARAPGWSRAGAGRAAGRGRSGRRRRELHHSIWSLGVEQQHAVRRGLDRRQELRQALLLALSVAARARAARARCGSRARPRSRRRAAPARLRRRAASASGA